MFNVAPSAESNRVDRPTPISPASSYFAQTSLKELRHLSAPQRTYEFVARRPDGTIFIGQERAPAVALFENAFSAFARGALVQTTNGEIAVEDLQPSDSVLDVDGQPSPVLWIGSSSFIPADTGRRTPLVRVMADSFGQGRPSGFPTFGPAARVLHTPMAMRGDQSPKPVLTSLYDLIDGINIIEISPPTPVQLFHLCLKRHSVVCVNGLELETYHPGQNTLRDIPLHMRDKLLSMFPHIKKLDDFGPLNYRRAVQVRTPAA
tara:strand:- start:459 stop:1244 length:786 start_codon:yes stop_codon:yes gene_type:complete